MSRPAGPRSARFDRLREAARRAGQQSQRCRERLFDRTLFFGARHLGEFDSLGLRAESRLDLLVRLTMRFKYVPFSSIGVSESHAAASPRADLRSYWV